MRIITDVTEAIESFGQAETLALDLETSGLHPFKDKIALLQLLPLGSKEMAVLHLRGHMPENLRKWLSRPGQTWVGHNILLFDRVFLAANGVDVSGVSVFDTFIAEQVVAYQDRKDVRRNLGATLKRRLNKTINKDIDHSYWMQETLSPTHIEYATNDVKYLHDLRRAQIDTARDRGLAEPLSMEMRLAPIVGDMTVRGMPLHLPTIIDNVEKVEAELVGVEAAIKEFVGYELNPASPVQVRSAFQNMGAMLSGTGRDIMVDTERKYYGTTVGKLAKEILHFRKLKKALVYDEAWYKTHTDKNGVVHGRFAQCGTDTTRFSSSEPNMQQIPKKMRSMFRSEDEWVVSADYSQIEARVAAALTEETGMLEAFANGTDVHRWSAAGIFNKSEDEVTEQERQLAKNCTWTVIFGGGARRIMEDSHAHGGDLTYGEAQRLLNNLLQRLPKIGERIAMARRIQDKKPKFATITLKNGHKRQLVGKNVTATRIVNTPIQGNAAAVMKQAILLCRERGLEEYLTATVHDELVAMRLPSKEAAEEYGAELRDVMNQAAVDIFPGMPVETNVTIGEAWG